MKLSTNLIRGKEKSHVAPRSNNHEDCRESRTDANEHSGNCMQFVKVILHLLIAFTILVIGWTLWIYLTSQLPSSNRETDTPSDNSETRRSEFKRILYESDDRSENEDSNGVSAEDVPWQLNPGNIVAASVESVEDDRENEVKIRTTPGMETEKITAGKLMQFWLKAVRNSEASINDRDKDESDSPTEKVGSTNLDYEITPDTDSSHRRTLSMFSDFFRRENRHSDYIRNFTTSRSDNDRLSDDATARPAMKIERLIRSSFDEFVPYSEKCNKSLEPGYEMMDELAIMFLTSDNHDMKIVEFRKKFVEYLTRFFRYVILPKPDQRQRIVKESDYELQNLLLASSNLITSFGRDYNFVKRDPPTREMTRQFRVIIETMIFRYEKCTSQ